MSGKRKEDEMICALTAGEYTALQKGLQGLPETVPQRAVWHRIREQAEAEGLLKQKALQKRSTWYAGVGVAAAVLVAALMLPGLLQQADETSSVVPQNIGTSQEVRLNALQALKSESRELETSLRALPPSPRVQRASTMATISDLEERIAAIDYQLHDPNIQMSDADRELFWRERVRLMRSLLQLRYAQAQRAAF